jgi:hypothetical protein
MSAVVSRYSTAGGNYDAAHVSGLTETDADPSQNTICKVSRYRHRCRRQCYQRR